MFGPKRQFVGAAQFQPLGTIARGYRPFVLAIEEILRAIGPRIVVHLLVELEIGVHRKPAGRALLHAHIAGVALVAPHRILAVQIEALILRIRAAATD